ncbi:hypothetical protein I7I50_02696 [Histoplasma capsulatum G186AR]|nr:hypothetical protein I7I52_00638 [Histoplasma capsulatum]QSS71737.1 hypothetical protein I7I50_02696 [Histoplasma capsulatum G186AR]
MEKRGNIGQNNADNRKSTVKVWKRGKVVVISLRNSEIPETCPGNKAVQKRLKLRHVDFQALHSLKLASYALQTAQHPKFHSHLHGTKKEKRKKKQFICTTYIALVGRNDEHGSLSLIKIWSRSKNFTMSAG